MQKRQLQSQLTTLWRQRNGYLCLAAGLVMVVLLQSLGLVTLASRWHVVVVPAHVAQSFWVSESEVSAHYLAEMTNYFAALLLNVTAESAAYQREAVLRYTAPAGYAALKAQLLLQEEKVRNEALTTAFYPVDIVTMPKRLLATITGDVKTWVGEQLTTTVRQTYQARYSYQDGRLLLQAFYALTPPTLKSS